MEWVMSQKRGSITCIRIFPHMFIQHSARRVRCSTVRSGKRKGLLLLWSSHALARCPAVIIVTTTRTLTKATAGRKGLFGLQFQITALHLKEFQLCTQAAAHTVKRWEKEGAHSAYLRAFASFWVVVFAYTQCMAQSIKWENPQAGWPILPVSIVSMLTANNTDNPSQIFTQDNLIGAILPLRLLGWFYILHVRY